MWVNLLLMIVGFAVLIWSADRFLSGAAATATNLGVSNIVIGLTIVSLGTSAPEIVVALIAALEGNPILAVGNAIGSMLGPRKYENLTPVAASDQVTEKFRLPFHVTGVNDLFHRTCGLVFGRDLNLQWLMQ